MIKNFNSAQKYKKIMMALTIFLIYLSLFLYQNVCGFHVNNSTKTNSINSNNFNRASKDNFMKESWIQSGDSKIMQKVLNQKHTTTATLNDEVSYNQIQFLNTPTPRTTDLDDIFISVKTTKDYHASRLNMIIKTWFQLSKDQTWFFTDTEDDFYQKLTNNHMIQTNCSTGHTRQALCCKMGKEFDHFLNSAKKYWCHFDDDNYVNIPRLVKVLMQYSPTQDWYLGKPSISSPIEMYLDNPKSLATKFTTSSNNKPKDKNLNKKVKFWFATGGAGFCVSRALAMKMLPIAGNGRFVEIGDKIRFPDDVTMGFIIEYLLNIPLTVVDAFHSHLEPMEFIKPDTFQEQVSFSYARMRNEWNVVKIDGGLSLETDPQRFNSLHCLLFPNFSYCNR